MQGAIKALWMVCCCAAQVDRPVVRLSKWRVGAPMPTRGRSHVLEICYRQPTGWRENAVGSRRVRRRERGMLHGAYSSCRVDCGRPIAGRRRPRRSLRPHRQQYLKGMLGGIAARYSTKRGCSAGRCEAGSGVSHRRDALATGPAGRSGRPPRTTTRWCRRDRGSRASRRPRGGFFRFRAGPGGPGADTRR